MALAETQTNVLKSSAARPGVGTKLPTKTQQPPQWFGNDCPWPAHSTHHRTGGGSLKAACVPPPAVAPSGRPAAFPRLPAPAASPGGGPRRWGGRGYRGRGAGGPAAGFAPTWGRGGGSGAHPPPLLFKCDGEQEMLCGRCSVWKLGVMVQGHTTTSSRISLSRMIDGCLPPESQLNHQRNRRRRRQAILGDGVWWKPSFA